jgi:predicted transposase/invertase (TIGR01784 family)
MIKACDAPYKLLFSAPDMVRDLVYGFIPDDWLRGLDYATLEKVSGSFTSDDLRERANDVVWRIKANGEWVYLYFLIEFQSTVDPHMAVRVMTYVGLLYQDVIRARVMPPGAMLPPVLPVVLYNGDRKWTAATDVAALIPPTPELVARYQPRLSYLLIDEGQYNAADLARMKNLMAWVIRFQRPESEGAMLELIEQLNELLRGKDELKQIFLLFMHTVVSRRNGSQPELPPAGNLLEMKMSLEQRFEQWKQEYQRKGLEEGRQQGLQQGEAAVLRKLLIRRFGPLPPEVQARIDAASAGQIDVWVDRVLDADSLEEVLGTD